MAEDPERLERLKFRLSLVASVVDKLLIAAFLAVLAFLLNRALESHKASIQKELSASAGMQQRQLDSIRTDQQKALEALRHQQDLTLEAIRGDQQKQLEAIRGSQQLQIEALRAAEDKRLESIRGDQLTQMELLRSSLAARSVVAQRQLQAYEAVYNDAVKLSRELDLIQASGSQHPQERREQLIDFRAAWQRNRLFLSNHAVGKVDTFLKSVEWQAIQDGDGQRTSEFRQELEYALQRLRDDMNEQIARDQRVRSP